MELRVAAAPVSPHDEQWLVVHGLAIGVRLSWNKEHTEVLRIQQGDEKTLKRL